MSPHLILIVAIAICVLLWIALSLPRVANGVHTIAVSVLQIGEIIASIDRDGLTVRAEEDNFAAKVTSPLNIRLEDAVRVEADGLPLTVQVENDVLPLSVRVENSVDVSIKEIEKLTDSGQCLRAKLLFDEDMDKGAIPVPVFTVNREVRVNMPDTLHVEPGTKPLKVTNTGSHRV